MKFLLSVVFILSAVWTPISAKCNCDSPMGHYKDMGCKPIEEKPGACCPKYYDCTEAMKRLASPDKCYFKGKEYKSGERVDNAITGSSCLAACLCQKDVGKDFNCAHIDCPEFLGGFPLKPNCVRQYKLDHCCSVGMACPPFEGLAQCKVDGQVFYEGQKFYPKDYPCGTCLCQKGFAGKFEEPFCRPVSCKSDLMHSIEFKRNCAPVYYTKTGCCPIQWECKSGKSYDNIGKKLDRSIDNNFCRFGDRMLKIGEKFDIERKYKFSPEINCECRVPPLVTCIQKPHQTN